MSTRSRPGVWRRSISDVCRKRRCPDPSILWSRGRKEKRVAIESPSQPFMAIAYKRPDQTNADDATFDVLSEVLSSERTGLIYKDMVRDKKIALGAGSQPAFPSAKYPALFLFFIAPAEGHSVEEN